MGVPNDDLNDYTILSKKGTCKSIIAFLKDEVAGAKLFEKLKRRFDSQFRYTDNGLPRIWTSHDDIDFLFQSAKSKVSLLFDIDR